MNTLIPHRPALTGIRAYAPMHIVAHRGLHTGPYGRSPENSLAAIQAAVDAGFERIEVDVRTTADGVPVLMHDSALVRTTDSRQLLPNLTAAQLRDVRLEDGSPVPHLAEALPIAHGRAVLCLDVKHPVVAQPLLALLERLQVRRGAVEVWSSHPEVVALASDRGYYTAWISHGLMPDDGVAGLADRGAQLGAKAISFYPADLFPTTGRICRRYGVDVMSGTPNDRATWDYLLRLGARAIITDRPLEARAWLAAQRAEALAQV